MKKSAGEVDGDGEKKMEPEDWDLKFSNRFRVINR